MIYLKENVKNKQEKIRVYKMPQIRRKENLNNVCN